jgi:hypothetical protein
MKKWLAIAVLVACTAPVFSQGEFDTGAPPSWKERIYTGGGLGMSGGSDAYGNRYFYIGLYPIIGYRVTPEFSAGVSLSWQHYDYTDIGVTVDQYGGAPFVRYNFGQLFLYSEFMILNSPTYDNTHRAIYNRWLIGAGFSQPVGRKGAINAMGLYDVLYKSSDRAFTSPWVFRVFFSI